MRVALNIDVMLALRSGMGRWAREMLRELSRRDAVNEYTLFHSNSYADPGAEVERQVGPLPGNFRLARLPFPRKAMLSYWLLADKPTLTRFLGDHDVFHFPSTLCLPVAKGRTIASIYDLSATLMPETCTLSHRLLMKHWTRRIVERCDRVATVSEYSKAELVGRLGLEPRRVTVLYSGVGEEFSPASDESVARLRERHGLRGRYFLFCGVLSRRKNVMTLVRAFAEARRRLGEDLTLVLAGEPGLGAGEVRAELARLGLVEATRFLGFVPDGDLPALYAGAEAFVFPSLFEGFGIPVIEAMACGAPVICSNSTCLPEVAGGAALLFETLDASALAEAMVKLVEDGTLRAALRARGLERAKRFSWGAPAAKLLELYSELSAMN